MSSRPLPADVEAYALNELAPFAVLRSDPALALEILRRSDKAGLKFVAADFAALREAAATALTSAESPRFGRPFVGRYPGRCSVCGEGVEQGAQAVYRAEDHAIAHAACAGRP